MWGLSGSCSGIFRDRSEGKTLESSKLAYIRGWRKGVIHGTSCLACAADVVAVHYENPGIALSTAFTRDISVFRAYDSTILSTIASDTRISTTHRPSFSTATGFDSLPYSRTYTTIQQQDELVVASVGSRYLSVTKC